MKKCLFCFALLVSIITGIRSQTILFEDDFEAGPDNWVVDWEWDVTDEYSFSGDYSFTESPDDITYLATEVQTATMAFGVDMSLALDADVKMQAIVDLEEGFDYNYLEVSTDGGVSWITVYIFNGEDMFDWTEYVIPLGGFVGHDDVRLRFRFDPDDFVEYDGLYIDDFVITRYNIDYSPPLILHTPSPLYEGTLEENNITAEIIDISGLSNTELFYSVDGASYISVTGINTSGDSYLFTIPAQEPGAVIDYYITATDDYVLPNTGTSITFTYISGNYIAYDDAAIDFVNDIGEESASGYMYAAVKMTLTGTTDVVAAVIQNYTDFTRPNDSIEIHVWADDGGEPGDDLITPFMLFPEATLAEPNKGTKVDLRPYSAELSDISGDIFIGFGSSDGLAWVSQTTPGIASRTYVALPGFGWFSLSDDYHFRIITSVIEGAPVANFSYNADDEPIIAFTDESTFFPDEWFWEFGDGSTSISENPSHEYNSNGSYYVCVTVTNDVSSDTYCEFIEIDSYLPPVAEYTFSGDPVVTFHDLSTNEPTSWYWIFDDGGATSTEPDPVHTFSANGVYNVCLNVENITGENTECKAVTIAGYVEVPVADFTYEMNDALVFFTDISTNAPTEWAWQYGDGLGSESQNPSHHYDSNGEYEVCLTAGNSAGESEICKIIQILVSVDEINDDHLTLYPNPADETITVQTFEAPGEKEILLVNTVGEVIFTIAGPGNTIDIDVKDIPEGIYFVTVTAGEMKGISSVVIDH
ncbi:MAG: PKD domain-containing protein [Chitinophagales bacterium]|nr:PKD domain-containing protein [Chitinophagales bacterium]